MKIRKLPPNIRKNLKKEAYTWDAFIAREKPEGVTKLFEKAEIFNAQRPPRKPVSIPPRPPGYM